MLQVARLAPKLLGESSDLVLDFVVGQFNSDGGVKDRAGTGDLYYTVFGMECLLALQAELPVESLARYLKNFGAGEDLDFIHVCCLTHCWAAMPFSPNDEARDGMLKRIDEHRAPDGGYNVTPDAEHGSAYGCFMASSAYQNLQAEMLRLDELIACLDSLRTDDGGYANDLDMKIGTTPATAAAVTLKRHLGLPADHRTGRWLLKQAHPEGGFLATPHAPMPDLLSTATALHALSGMQTGFEQAIEPCLDYIDSLWTNKGSFHGNWADEELDVEYTYYGLLALGHLSL